MRGISRSVTRTSKAASASRTIASAPSAAVVTSKPAFSSIWPTNFRTLTESSTSSTRGRTAAAAASPRRRAARASPRAAVAPPAAASTSAPASSTSVTRPSAPTPAPPYGPTPCRKAPSGLTTISCLWRISSTSTASVRPAPRTTITGRRGRRGRRSRPRMPESGTRSTRSSPTTIASPRGPGRTSSGRTSVTSCAALSGTAIRSSPTVIMRASETSSVSGRRSVKRVPSPTTLRTSTSPFRRRTFVRTTSRPTPRPAAVVTALAVLKPGRKTRSRAALSSSSAPAGPVRVDAASVVRDLHEDGPALVRGRQRHRARRVLAAGVALLGRLDAVGDRVLHQVEQRIHDLLDDGGVELDGFAARLEAHGLARGPRGLLPLPHEPAEEAADRHQTRAPDLAAQRAGDPVHVRDVVAERAAHRRQLGLQLRDVGRDLGHRPREDPGVVVAVEFELREELGDRQAGRGRGRRLRRLHGTPQVELTPLEVGDALGEAAATGEERRR